MASDSGSIWFPAKRYGWGWGFPIAWQGWVVMAIWLIGIVVGACMLERASWIVLMVVLTALLVAVCYAKGEKPRWRWGER